MRQVLPQIMTMTAKGSSMNLAGINDGDLLCINTQQRPLEGDIVVAQVGEEGVTVKRLAVDGWAVWLVADSDEVQWQRIQVDDTVEIIGVVEGRRHPELGLVPLRPTPRVLPLQIPIPEKKSNETRRQGVARTFQEVPAPKPPRHAYTQPVARYSRIGEQMAWQTYAGMVGDYERIDPHSPQRAWVLGIGAEWSDYVVVAATDTMAGRGIEDGDLLFVKTIAPHRLWGGHVVLADLGDLGTVVGELHEDGKHRFLRSNQGRKWEDEMHLPVRDSEIRGLVFMVGG